MKPVIQKTAAEKGEISKFGENEKQAGVGTMAKAVWNGGTMEMARKLLVAPIITGAVLGTASLIHGAGMDAVTRLKSRSALEEAKRINPKLNSIPQETLDRYFDLVVNSSPTVATKPILLANYLDYMIAHDGSLNFAAFKQLAELEGTMANTAKTNRPLGDMAVKAIIDGSVKATFPK